MSRFAEYHDKEAARRDEAAAAVAATALRNNYRAQAAFHREAAAAIREAEAALNGSAVALSMVEHGGELAAHNRAALARLRGTP